MLGSLVAALVIALLVGGICWAAATENREEQQ